MTAQCLTSSGDTGNHTDDPYRELMAGIIKNARDDIERLTNNAKDATDSTYLREYVEPVVRTLGWLAFSDFSAPLNISFKACCEYLGFDPDVVKERLIALYKQVPDAGHRSVNYYIERLLHDRGVARQFYEPPRRTR